MLSMQVINRSFNGYVTFYVTRKTNKIQKYDCTSHWVCKATPVNLPNLLFVQVLMEFLAFFSPELFNIFQ